MNTLRLNTETDAEIILRMADLIEKGSKDAIQGTGMYFIEDKVCAIGACLKAAGITKDQANRSNFSVMQTLGITTWPLVELPYEPDYKPFAVRLNGKVSLVDAIINLNDSAGWDFAHIIQWLRDTAEAMVTA